VAGSADSGLLRALIVGIGDDTRAELARAFGLQPVGRGRVAGLSAARAAVIQSMRAAGAPRRG
jgi:hypothetical protein